MILSAQDINSLHLPPLLRIIVESMGDLDAAIALVAEFGGQQVYVPKKVGDDHPFVRVGGRIAAEAIVKAFGGERIIFPSGKFNPRYLKAVALLREGATLNTVVRATRLHHRQVKRIKSEMRGGNQ
jgi:hypothetical protein